MEQKLVRVPFDLELAKKITNGEVEGRIVTREGRSARVICWDRKGKFPIMALIDNGDDEGYQYYYADGIIEHRINLGSDLMLEIPEYMTFKDGDILMLRNQYHFVFVYNSEFGKYGSYFGITLDDYDSFFDSEVTSEHDENIIEFRKANTEEEQKLIEALKARKEPKAKEYLKRFFGIEQKQEYEFKPFDKVLVRDDKYECWRADIFSHKDKNDEFFPWFCIGVRYKYCIPYNDQTKHLLGTTENWEE